jgi:hypothetical protein
MRKIVANVLMGKESELLPGFLNYHYDYVDRFEIIFNKNETDDATLQFAKACDKVVLTETSMTYSTSQGKMRELLQSRTDLQTEVAWRMDVDERMDLKTLLEIDRKFLESDITYGFVRNSDNYFVIDGFPKILFSTTPMVYEYKSHPMGRAINPNPSTHFIHFPVVNHVVQTRSKTSGFEELNDARENPDKYLDKRLIKFYSAGNYQGVISLYEELYQGLTVRRQRFMCFLVYVLACNELKRAPETPHIGYSPQTTKTEMAVDYLYRHLTGTWSHIDLGRYQDHQFRVSSQYAIRKAMLEGALDSSLWNSLSHD